VPSAPSISYNDNDEQNSLDTALSAILRQLFSCNPALLRHAEDAWTKNVKMTASHGEKLWRILMGAASDREKGEITRVLDALVECWQQGRFYLIDLLCRLYTSSRHSQVTFYPWIPHILGFSWVRTFQYY